MSAEKIQKIYDGVLAIIEHSKQLLEETAVPDTDAMKIEVERLCKAINALPVAERVAYADSLGVLFNSLSTLEAALQKKRAEVGSMLTDAPTHHAASRAYTKVAHSDKKPEGND